MKLLLLRYESVKNSTPGALFVEGAFACFTLEDMVRRVKILGETAIPAGTYKVTFEDSPKFGPGTITLHNVHGYTDVRAHGGNTIKDTKGCILVGLSQQQGWLGDSQDGLTKLKVMINEQMQFHGPDIEITIVDHKPYNAAP